jgi:hypothetical protein
MRPLSVGRVSGAFHPAKDDQHPIVLLLCQDIFEKHFSKRAGASVAENNACSWVSLSRFAGGR